MFLYNDSYLKTYKRYRDILNTDVVVIVNKLPSQTEDLIFKIKAIVKTRVFNNGEMEINTSEIIFFTDELKELRSENGSITFPIKDIANRVKLVRVNGFSYAVEAKNINFFENLVKFTLSSQI